MIRIASTKDRLRALSAYLEKQQPSVTTFITEGGAEFRTTLEPFEYLRQHGVYTPGGQRIVLYPHPVEGIDGLSLSLYQMIDEVIEKGGVELPDLESDEVM